MSTGDLHNNFERLRSEAKSTRYTHALSFEKISTGDAKYFLPLLDHALVHYRSPPCSHLQPFFSNNLTAPLQPPRQRGRLARGLRAHDCQVASAFPFPTENQFNSSSSATRASSNWHSKHAVSYPPRPQLIIHRPIHYRQVLGCTPLLKTDQFLAPGFAERKIMYAFAPIYPPSSRPLFTGIWRGCDKLSLTPHSASSSTCCALRASVTLS